MTTEKIELRPSFLTLGKTLVSEIIGFYPSLSTGGQPKLVIGIAGESGSGKSVTALVLKHVLAEAGIRSVVLSIDNYFKLAPKQNDLARRQNIDQVGPSEVRLALLQAHLFAFVAGHTAIVVPVTDYANDRFEREVIDLEDMDVLIVEGTYVYMLDGIDRLVFLDHNYKDTHAQRLARNRDKMDDFVEQVLEIEHKIISEGRQKADFRITTDYQVNFVQR
jgi:uridine kinase